MEIRRNQQKRVFERKSLLICKGLREKIKLTKMCEVFPRFFNCVKNHPQSDEYHLHPYNHHIELL